jgi:hypothetical protein
MAFANHRAFTRSGVEEEEITPPCLKTRSFDSLSVAHILAGQAYMAPGPSKLTVSTDAASNSPSPATSSPNSPSIDAAAAMLQRVQSEAAVDGAADCLMSLAALSSMELPPPQPPQTQHSRTAPAPSKRSKASSAEGADGARRRLKMRGGSSALPSPLAGAGVSKASGKARAAAGVRQQAQQRASAPSSTQHAAVTRLGIPGVSTPIRLLSGASLTQLKLLAAAFKLCPSPTAEQVHAIARRVGLTPEKLETWFQSRRTLQAWAVSQPQLRPADLAGMFYRGGAAAP